MCKTLISEWVKIIVMFKPLGHHNILHTLLVIRIKNYLVY